PVQPLALGLQLRKETNDNAFPAPRLFISGPGFTAPGGWAGSFDPSARMEPRSVADAKEKVALLSNAKVDFLKVFYDSMGCSFSNSLPKLTQPLLDAIVAEAHARQLKVMVHVYETADHKDALKAGADIMAHSAITATVDDE